MTTLQTQRVDWRIGIVTGLSILLTLNFLLLLILILTLYLHVGYPGILSSIFIITVIIGLRFFTLPVSIVCLVLSIFFFKGRPKKIKIWGIATGLLGFLLGIFMVILMFLLQSAH